MGRKIEFKGWDATKKDTKLKSFSCKSGSQFIQSFFQKEGRFTPIREVDIVDYIPCDLFHISSDSDFGQGIQGGDQDSLKIPCSNIV